MSDNFEELQQAEDSRYPREEKREINISMPEEKYGVCTWCGCTLGKHDIAGMHGCCSKSMYGI